MTSFSQILIINPALARRSHYRQDLQETLSSLVPVFPYEIMETESALQALALCEQALPDCILLPTRLTEMTGIEFLQCLQQQVGLVSLPVIMLIAEGSAALAEAALAHGAQDYLMLATLTPELLGRTVRSVITQARLKQQLAQVSAEPDRTEPGPIAPTPAINALPSSRRGQLFATIDDLVLIRDGAGRCQVILTPRANHLLYKSPLEMVGSTLHDALPTPVADQLLVAIQQALSSGHTMQVEYCLPINNRDVWFDARISPIDDTSTILIAREINDRKQMEAALQRANQRLQDERNLFVNGPVVIFKWQAVAGWLVAYVSPNVEALLEYALDDWLSGQVQYTDVVFPTDLDRVIQEVMTHSASGALHFQHQPYRIVTRSGQVRWVDDYTTILRNDQGEVTHYLGYVFDVTNLRRAETDSQQSRKLLHAVIDTIPQYIFWKDANLGYLGCNRNFAQAVGMTHPREVIGKTDADLRGPAALIDRCRDGNSQVMATDQPQLHRVESVRQADGRVSWLDINQLPLHDGEGQVIGVLGTCEDITDRKQREEIIQNIALGVSAQIGEAFFQSLAQHLSKALGVEFAFVGEIDPSTRDHIRLLAGYGDGQVLENFSYALTGTPCEQVVGNQAAIYAHDIQQIFPQHDLLRELGVEGYVGIPLFDSGGHAQGVIVILSRHPLVDTQLIAEVMKIFAARVSAEIERQRTEVVLRRSEERWQLAIQATNEGICDVDLTTNSVFYSSRWKSMLGYGETELLDDGQEWRQRIHPDDYDRVMAANEALFQRETLAFVDEYRLRHRDGTYIWVFDRALAVWDAAGKPLRLVGAITDITARKQAEAEQQRQAQRSQLFAEITLKIRQSLQLEEIWHTTVTEVQRILEADRVILFKFLPEGTGMIVKTAISALQWELSEHMGANPCYDDNVLQQYRQGQISRANDIETAEFPASYVEFLRAISVRACLVVPILQADQLWGLLIADQCQAPRQWTDAETDLLQQIANQVGIAIQQSQLYQQTRQQAQQAEGLNRVVQAMRQSLDLSTIFATATQDIGQLLDVERSAILQYYPSEHCWRNVAVYRKYANMPYTDGLNIPDQNNPLAQRLKQFEVVRIDDATTVPDPIHRALAQKYPGAWLMVPLGGGGVIWGCLALLKEHRPIAWSDQQVELTQAIADQLAIAIQQANLYQQAQQELAERQRAETELQLLNQQLEERVRQRTQELEWSQVSLRQREREFRTLVENSPDRILRLDRSFRYLYVNPKVINTTGLAAADMIGKPIQAIGFPDELAQQWETTMQQACDTEQEQIISYEMVLPEGKQYHESRVAPELSPTGQVESILVVIRDITALKQAETALRQQVEREQLIAMVTQRMRSSLDLHEILNCTVVEVQQALQTDRVIVYRVLPDGARQAISEATAPHLAPLLYLHAATPMMVSESDHGYLQGLTYVLNDREQEAITPALGHFLRSLGVQAEVVVPIVFTDSRQAMSSLWGLLIVHQCHAPRSWQAWEIKLLQQIAAALVIAIQQADLYAQVQAELADRHRAEAQLRTSLHEKEVLLKEVHHRVKNNMQLMSSLLSLQAQSIEDPKILVEFQESQRRIAAMATMHEQLYRADNLGKINMSGYIKNLANSLFQSNIVKNTDIHLNVETVNVELGIDIAIPCGLIINELVSNSTKYAFPEDRSGHIAIRFLAASPHHYQLIVQDDGVGIPPHVNIASTSSLGLQIVKDLTEQLDGTLTCDRQGGTAFVITFPAPETP